MTLEQAITTLNELERVSQAYEHAMGCLSFDGLTIAPKQSWRKRGDTMPSWPGSCTAAR